MALDIGLYSPSGQRISTIFSGEAVAGTHQFYWTPAGHLTAGYYNIGIQVNGQVAVLQVLLK